MGKLTLLAGGAVGYVLGTRAGRERFEQIKSQAQSLWNNPKVQEKATAAQDFAKEKAPEVKDKVTGAAKDKMGQSDTDTTGTTTSTTTSVATPARSAARTVSGSAAALSTRTSQGSVRTSSRPEPSGR